MRNSSLRTINQTLLRPRNIFVYHQSRICTAGLSFTILVLVLKHICVGHDIKKVFTISLKHAKLQFPKFEKLFTTVQHNHYSFDLSFRIK